MTLQEFPNARVRPRLVVKSHRQCRQWQVFPDFPVHRRVRTRRGTFLSLATRHTFRARPVPKTVKKRSGDYLAKQVENVDVITWLDHGEPFDV
jgi:hypothetical protein